MNFFLTQQSKTNRRVTPPTHLHQPDYKKKKPKQNKTIHLFFLFIFFFFFRDGGEGIKKKRRRKTGDAIFVKNTNKPISLLVELAVSRSPKTEIDNTGGRGRERERKKEPVDYHLPREWVFFFVLFHVVSAQKITNNEKKK